MVKYYETQTMELKEKYTQVKFKGRKIIIPYNGKRVIISERGKADQAFM